MSPSFVDRVDLEDCGVIEHHQTSLETGSVASRTTFSVRSRTRLSFAYFSLEDAPQEVPLGDKEKVGAAPHRGEPNRPIRKQVQRMAWITEIKPHAKRAKSTNQRITRRKSARIAAIYAVKRAPSAPSM